MVEINLILIVWLVFPCPYIFIDLDNVEGIAVDWIGNNLYWTNDGQRKTINVARLEKASQSRKTLLEGEMSHPRGIVVDPVNGYVSLLRISSVFYILTMAIFLDSYEFVYFPRNRQIEKCTYLVSFSPRNYIR